MAFTWLEETMDAILSRNLILQCSENMYFLYNYFNKIILIHSKFDYVFISLKLSKHDKLKNVF
jgi:hypothetical protein